MASTMTATGGIALWQGSEAPLKPLFLAALLSLATSGPGTAQQTPPCCTATIRIRVPERTGVVYLTGSLAQLGP